MLSYPPLKHSLVIWRCISSIMALRGLSCLDLCRCCWSVVGRGAWLRRADLHWCMHEIASVFSAARALRLWVDAKFLTALPKIVALKGKRSYGFEHSILFCCDFIVLPFFLRRSSSRFLSSNVCSRCVLGTPCTI